MRYENNERLRAFLDRGAAGVHREFIERPAFDLDANAVSRHLADVREQHPQLSDEESLARAVFRVLTSSPPAPNLPVRAGSSRAASLPGATAIVAARPVLSNRNRLRSCARIVWPWLKAAWAITLLLLVARAAHGAPKPRPNALRAVRTAFDLPAEPSDGVIIQFQNAGTPLATRPAGLVAINCGTNMSCSFASGVFNLTASSTASTAFGALTAGTNSNAGTFVASGNTWDFSGATLKTSWLSSGTLPGSTGQLLYNNGGAIGAEDPIVSGPDAPGTAPTANPVQIGGFDGTDVRRILTDASGNVEVNVANMPTVTVGNASIAVTGTFWQATQPISAASLPLPAGAATAAKQPTLGTAGTPSADVISVQGEASMTALKVDGSAVTQPVSGTVTATQTSGSNLHVDVDAAPANQSVNVAQVGGTAVVADPCRANAKSYASVNQTASAQLATGTAGKKIYICSINLVTATAQNIALVEGTGTTCGTSTAGVPGFGGSTAATGWNLAANGGLTYGNGASALGRESTAADNVCLLQSSSGQVSGGISYVAQ